MQNKYYNRILMLFVNIIFILNDDVMMSNFPNLWIPHGPQIPNPQKSGDALVAPLSIECSVRLAYPIKNVPKVFLHCIKVFNKIMYFINRFLLCVIKILDKLLAYLTPDTKPVIDAEITTLLFMFCLPSFINNIIVPLIFIKSFANRYYKIKLAS